MKYYIYSIEHGAWWKPNEFGYTRILSEAGLYDKIDAKRILINANIFQTEPNEIMVDEDTLF